MLKEIISGEYTNKYEDKDLPLVSIIIPTFNCAQTIALTMNQLLEQDYPHFEVIVIDAGSTDRTVEVLEGYKDTRIRLYSAMTYQRYAMFNKGISFSMGKYLNFLFPGDFYIRPDVIRMMMTLALNEGNPQLVFSGTLLRDGKNEVKFMFRQFTTDLLRRGQQPTSLQACWFKREIFDEIGRFRTDYQMRGGFDLLCRFQLHGKWRSAAMPYAFTDYDLRWVTHPQVFRHLWESMKTVHRYFGFYATLGWFFRQKDTGRFIKLWSKGIKVAFSGKR